MESDRFEDAITFDHLRFLHEINDGLGGNVYPNVSDMGPKLHRKIDIIEERTTAGVRVVVVWEHRPIADEILAPRAKLPTAVDTPPKYGSGIIGGLGPPSTNGVNCEEPVKVI